jgi:hypothetical protein
MKTKTIAILLSVVGLTGGVTNAQNLLLNGDFSLGSNGTVDPDTQALNWTHAWFGGWISREQNGNGTYGDPLNFHYALGNAGGINNAIYQSVLVPDNGAAYQLTVDMAMDNWWKPDAFMKIEFRDSLNNILSFNQADFFAGGYDGNVNQPWANRSVSGIAPAGTASITVVFSAIGEGGTTRWDNAVLATVVPEPASAALVALGAATLISCRSRRNATRA